MSVAHGMKKHLIVCTILSLLFGILLFEAYTDSGTYDEIAHITAGYTYLFRHDFRLYPDNPPLIKMISVLPWGLYNKSIHFPGNSPYYQENKSIDQWSFGREFLYKSGNNADELIFLARLSIITLTLALGLLVFWIARNIFGFTGGVFALVFYTLSPDIRAHGHLATTDVGASFFAILSLYIFYKTIHTYIYPKLVKGAVTHKNIVNWKIFMQLIFGSFFFSLALLSKYSMWFMLATLVCIIFLYLMYLYLFKQIDHKMCALKAILSVISVIFLSYIFLWSISYCIGYTQVNFRYEEVGLIKSARSQLSNSLGWKLIHLFPLPYYYTVGLETMYARNLMTQPIFLLGTVVPVGGWKLFFPVSYILKTPLPILLFTYLSLWISLKKKNVKNILVYVSGFMFFFLISSIGNLSIGTRFIFPSTVLFIITASGAISLYNRKNIRSKAFFVISLLWLFCTNILSFPYDISYVNELSGMTMNGYRSLVDSSYDWGQDLKRLSQWYKYTIPNEKITLSYFGTADPAYYGIDYQPLTFSNIESLSGYVVISVTNLKLGGRYYKDSTGQTLYDEKPLAKFLDAKPITRIGTTLFVYKFP